MRAARAAARVPGSRARRRGAPLAALLAATPWLAACDPCAGVPACSGDRRVAASGRIIDFKTGQSRAGVGVTFRRTGGAELRADELSAVTDGEGLFTLAGEAIGTGPVEGVVTVRPAAPAPSYQIGGLALPSSTRYGAGVAFPSWLVQPWVTFVGELRDAGTGAPVVGAQVTFVRTGGTPIGAETIATATNFGGQFYLETPAAGADDVIGTLSVAGGTLSRAYRIENVRLRPRVTDERQQLDALWRLDAAGAVAVGTVAARSCPAGGVSVTPRAAAARPDGGALDRRRR